MIARSAQSVESVAVVLFAYDEKGNLLRLLRRLQKTLAEIIPAAVIQYGICVQGEDGTLEEARVFESEAGDKETVAIAHSPRPLGIRPACTRAFGLVEGPVDAYLMMDCDLNHQPEELPAFFEALRSNSVVVGSRYCSGGSIVGMPLWKRNLSKWFNYGISLILFFPVRDKTSGYRLIRGSMVPQRAAVVSGEGFEFYFEFLLLLWRHGFKVVEVPIQFTARTVGTSKMAIAGTSVGYLRSLARLLRLRWGGTPEVPGTEG